MSSAYTDAAGIPVDDPSPVSTFSPVTLPVPGRATELQIRVSAPATGTDHPILLLSHGHGSSHFLSSLHGYGPVADFWVARGFVVVQPTHLDSTALGLRDADDPQAPLYWRSRVEDMHHVLDHLEEIEATVPGLGGRVDPGSVVAVGHSLGGHTVGMLCGQRARDPVDGSVVDLTDPRVAAGVLMAAPGNGAGLDGPVREHYPVLGTTDFTGMATPALVVVGDHDHNPAFSSDTAWRADAYHSSPGPKSLLTLFGAEHALGGVAGYDAAETTDESPERVAALRALVWAYLRTALDPADPAWADATAALERMPDPPGRIESK